jgi:outer membrane protein assembly factor BamB
MKLFAALLLFALAAASLGSPPSPDNEALKNWPQWRGPLATGEAPGGNPPVEWSETKNVKWKVEIPGRGSATPVIWGKMIIVQTAVPTGKKGEVVAEPAPPGPGRRGPGGNMPTEVLRFTVLAIDRETGKRMWERVVREAQPHEGTHPTGTWASPSPATDGQNIYAYFGSQGLYCLDLKGNVKWEKDLGRMTIRMGFGEGSSAALYKDSIIVNWDHERGSFITALDKKTGKELWRTPREEATTWSTPLVVEHNGRTQIVTGATSRVRSYDFATGKLLWESKGLTPNAIPSPVFGDGMVYVMSGFRGNALYAIRLDKAQGDIGESEAIVWSHDRDTPYVPSPLLYGGQLYFLKSNNGILSAFDARTGKAHYSQVRIEAVPNVYASPVGAAGRVYIAGREGATAVIAHGPEFKLLAANQLDDGFDASPAVVGSELYLRGRKHLYKIAEK